ncbi:MAG: MTH1187 family thiamine-binding protein [Acidobacteria bacterium]|nr:MTH1187 family thiamine-binding protein [Acidobacteriota bacterium]NIM63149.1 MTH1187 family thiamine-binding protein [Acidobacteriota bacterium]NIQ86470.1 MTH1187 family thiamine-binding protein [Acidobacteriota bacterium]NIT10815.1 MTH1187 family thiamine-binding protein [Acidobacteriota bacterium]
MKAVAEIQIIPIGSGTSVRPWVRRAQAIIAASDLVVQEHSFGTNVEGELETVFRVLREIHETLHAEGVVRLSSAIKIGTRTDKSPDLASKLRE